MFTAKTKIEKFKKKIFTQSEIEYFIRILNTI